MVYAWREITKWKTVLVTRGNEEEKEWEGLCVILKKRGNDKNKEKQRRKKLSGQRKNDSQKREKEKFALFALELYENYSDEIFYFFSAYAQYGCLMISMILFIYKHFLNIELIYFHCCFLSRRFHCCFLSWQYYSTLNISSVNIFIIHPWLVYSLSYFGFSITTSVLSDC